MGWFLGVITSLGSLGAPAALVISLVAFSVGASPSLAVAAATKGQQTRSLLSSADVARYRKIFALQSEGRWPTADRLIEALDNPILLGRVLAQRFLHPTAYKSSYGELRDWLKKFADHPEARRIHALALARRPEGEVPPRRPDVAKNRLADEPPLDLVHLYESGKRLSKADRRKVRRLKRQIRHNLRRVYLSKTERLLERQETRRLLDSFEIDEATAKVASGWLHYGSSERAFRLAAPVADRAGEEIPIAHWTTGLAAWRLGKIAVAARHFESLALSGEASAWNRAAGAYWAARAHQRQGAPVEAHRWLTVAASLPPNFYSLLAQRRLNLHHGVAFNAPDTDPIWLNALSAKPRGARAIALLRVGQRGRAEEELLQLGHWRQPTTLKAILALVEAEKLARLGFEIAQRIAADADSDWNDQNLAALMYPLPPWRPRDGFILDRALILAFMKQESSFDTKAKSPYGARGLMQLMPRTAASIDKRHDFRGEERDLLFDPVTNVTLGQRYLLTLLTNRQIKRDLLHLAAAYNAGLGNLRKWKRSMDHGNDPLLFIESFPVLETRLFAERVLTNLWIYRLRFGQDTPSLDALAADRWPLYEPLDIPAMQSSVASGSP